MTNTIDDTNKAKASLKKLVIARATGGEIDHSELPAILKGLDIDHSEFLDFVQIARWRKEASDVLQWAKRRAALSGEVQVDPCSLHAECEEDRVALSSMRLDRYATAILEATADPTIEYMIEDNVRRIGALYMSLPHEGHIFQSTQREHDDIESKLRSEISRREDDLRLLREAKHNWQEFALDL